MNNLIKLTKINLLTFGEFYKVKNAKTSKEKRKASSKFVLMLFLLIYFGFCIYLLADQMMKGFMLLNAPSLLLGFFMMISSLFILLTNILKINGILFNYKDYDLLMSLPIKTEIVIASKLTLLYVFNLMYALLFMIPSMIVYINYVDVSIIFYLLFVITVLFIPVLPIVIASIIGTILTSITSKFEKKKLGQTIFTFALLLGIMYLQQKLVTMKDIDIAGMATSLLNTINKVYPLVNTYVDILANSNILSLIIFTVLPILVFYVFVQLLNKNYESINTRLSNVTVHNKFKIKEYKMNSPLKALYKKELSKFLSSPNYIINNSFGAIFSIIAVLLFVFMGSDKLDSLLQMEGFSDLFIKTGPILLGSFAAMCCTTCSSISLEGKNLWIIKSIPAKTLDIFKSKILVNLTLIIPVMIINAIILSIYLKVSILTFIFMLVLPIFYAIFISQLGLVINLLFPNFEWKNEIVVIKQSTAAFLSVMLGMVVAVVPLIIPYHFSTNIYMTLVLLVIIILNILLYVFLKSEGIKKFNNL